MAGPQQPFSSSKAVLHLAELSTLVAVLRPVYAIGYIATLQKELGLDKAFPVPKFPPGGGKVAYKEQRAEVERGMRDARAGAKPSLLVLDETKGQEHETSRA
ncbi:hypothetical protein ACG04R_16380 [Roseateles sp. BYS78W]|uniref:Uncharacterized protein n=1 Tax=Pelomonas candidula TaxID=3299025 RepID=A0ABW7HEC4_9BURK